MEADIMTELEMKDTECRKYLWKIKGRGQRSSYRDTLDHAAGLTPVKGEGEEGGSVGRISDFNAALRSLDQADGKLQSNKHQWLPWSKLSG